MTALALLQSAVMLLTMVISLGNTAPEELRTQAISVANQAIVVASAQIDAASTTQAVTPDDNTDTVTQPDSTPVVNNGGSSSVTHDKLKFSHADIENIKEDNGFLFLVSNVPIDVSSIVLRDSDGNVLPVTPSLRYVNEATNQYQISFNPAFNTLGNHSPEITVTAKSAYDSSTATAHMSNPFF